MNQIITKGQARYALLILLLVNAVNYMDRMVVPILFPLIKKDLVLSDTELGLIGGLAFTLVYALAAIPVGWATDRFNRKAVISAGILVWSVATAMSGIGSRFSTLFAARSLTATGEASCHPCGISLISDYFSPKVRTTAIAVFQLGIPLGGGLGVVLGGVLAAKYGWRSTFFLYALPGIVLLPLILMMKDPARGASEGITTEKPDVKNERFLTGLKRILKLKSLQTQYLVALFTQLGLMSFSVWMPTYLVRARGFDISGAGKIMGAAFLVGGIFGAVGGGAIADRWFRKDKSARVKLQTLALVLTLPFALTAMLIDSRAVLLVSIFMTSILATACYPICSAILVDVLSPRERGIGMSFLLIVQNGIGLTLASLLVGAISDMTGSLLHGLMVAPVSIIVAIGFSMTLKEHYLSDYKTLAVT